MKIGIGRDPSTLADHGVERPWTLHVDRPTAEVVRVELAGAWQNEHGLPDPNEVWRGIEVGPPAHLRHEGCHRVGLGLHRVRRQGPR